MDDKEFKNNFRMQRQTAYSLIEDYEKSNLFLKRNDTHHGGSIPISAETQMLSFLWFACNKICLRDVAQRFGLGATTLFYHINKLLNYFILIAPTIIKLPSTIEDKERSATEFAKFASFPNVLGCIDGSYINIRTPAHKLKSTYTNRHDLLSLILQGVCNYERKFIDVFTGVPGKMHDSRVYKLSDFSKKISSLCGNNSKYQILGDAAYNIRENLLVPYKDYGNLSPSHTNFNQRLSATRVLIENSFGILKGRFRQLLQIDMHSVDKISKFVIACCVLHNLCINHNDLLDEEEIYNDEDQTDEDAPLESDRVLRQDGEIKRDRIRNYLDTV